MNEDKWGQVTRARRWKNVLLEGPITPREKPTEPRESIKETRLDLNSFDDGQREGVCQEVS